MYTCLLHCTAYSIALYGMHQWGWPEQRRKTSQITTVSTDRTLYYLPTAYFETQTSTDDAKLTRPSSCEGAETRKPNGYQIQ